MKLLLFSDLHLDAPFRGGGPELARRRRRGLREALQRIVELTHAIGADALLCGGDLYEQEHFSPDTVAFLAETFSQVNVPVLIAPGNHDWFGPRSVYAQATWSQNVHIFTETELTAFELADGFTVRGAAHRAPANTDGFLDSGWQVDRDGVHIGLFHGSERSALSFQEEGKEPHAPFSADQIPAAGLHHALLGHFHVPRDAQWHTYPGNPEPLTFGETGMRGAVLVSVSEDGRVERERHEVATLSAHDVIVDVTGASTATVIRDRVCTALSGHRGIARVTVTGELGADVDLRLEDLDGVAGHLDGAVIRFGRLTSGYDITALADENTIRGQFVRDVVQSELDDDEQLRVLVTGLRALDRRREELEVH